MLVPGLPSMAPELERDMREHLARSLERLGDMARKALGDDVDLQALLGHIRTHRVDPGVFARYYDLIFALQAGDHAAARRLWREIADLAVREAGLQLTPYGRETLGDDAERFARLCSTAYGGASLFAAPDPADWRRFELVFAEAMSLLDQASPAWAAEVRALVSRIIGARPSGEAGAPGFGGASCFMVWGAVFLNVARGGGRLDVLSGLVHEATHQLLFALSREEPLVTNPPGARYRSPLREDARPMDGVFHATYVAARLSALYEILQGAPLSPAETSGLDARARRSRLQFQEGHRVVSAEALLTPLGQGLIQEAADHVMATA